MRNPLYRRLPRELKEEIGKYAVLFLFLVVTIGFICGYMVANGSMTTAYDRSFDKYQIENGHFILGTEANGSPLDAMGDLKDIDLAKTPSAMSSSSMLDTAFATLIGKADGDVIERIQREAHVEIEAQFYKEKSVTSGTHKNDTFRIYRNRKKINKVQCMEGHFPKTDREIMIDRLYAENNNLKIGDSIPLAGKKYIISGFSAFSDYTALFKTNADMMFDANHFTVALVTDSAWNQMNNGGIKYCYAWRNKNQRLTDKQQRDKGEDIIKILATEGTLQDMVTRPDNNAINFAGDDISGDRVMMQWMLYIIMVIIAFIYGVSTRSTIESEAKTIGTLRASGYSRGELLRHYLALPMIVTLIAAIIGNILGYTVMKNVVVSMYYHSYSLPTYTTLWNGDAFLQTTVIPVLIILAVNVLVIGRALRYEPLQFLRGELRKSKSHRKTLPLRHGSFPSRFRLRIIIQNRGAYLTLFIGIFLASILLLFGMGMKPMLDHFRGDILNSQFAKYQYILKTPVYVDDASAEKYAYTSLENDNGEQVGIYGIAENSKYFKGPLIENPNDNGALKVLASSSYMDKYRLKEGQRITLRDKYEGKKYTFILEKIQDHPSSLCLFLPLKTYNKLFDNPENYYMGYLSNHKLDINDVFVASTITEKDLTLTADQLESSMGSIFGLFQVFSAVLYILILYLLAKVAIDRNRKSISIIKILGYTDREISALYSRATGIVSIVSLVICTFLSEVAFRWIFYLMMQEYTGWITFYVPISCYLEILGIGILSYLAVSWSLMKRIRKIPMGEAVKNNE